ncbi:MAG: hypothetical protein EOO88_29095 [Pedobacter sp.]|nr:MAG: hypothetical protein EOO88_29095 [Pedobacter sp.]
MFIVLNYQFSPAFKASSVASLSYESASRDTYVPSNVLDGNIYAASITSKRQLITINTSVNYIHRFSEALKLDMTIGNELRTIDDKLTSVDGSKALESGGSDYVKIVTGYNASQTNALSDHEMEKLVSFYGTWKWNYKSDLDVNMVLRADGSSLYENKWALYPALGIHYNLNNIANIPVKASIAYGKTGVLSGAEAYRGELDAYGDYFGRNELGIGLLYPAFREAKSVEVYRFDAGLEIRILPVLDLCLNYFDKTYKDFTYQRFLPNISGTDYQYETGSSLGLSGIEAEVRGKWFNTSGFRWTTDFNIAAYQNKVKSLPDDRQSTSVSFLTALNKGDALSSLVAYEAGIAKVIGNGEAKAFGGISNSFGFKDVTLSFTANYTWGADVLAESFSSTYYADLVGNKFPLKNAETPYYLSANDLSGRTVYQGIRTIEDASFISLSRASLSYNIGPALKQIIAIRDMHLFLRGDNLLTITNYSGVNPEENITAIRKRNLSLTGTPLPSSIVLGLKLML